ncbi:MAG: histidine phosphatase family protein [Rhodocyclaceae bacterium]|nr:histidine phosphatase family protein [Rhodocyclaceae bacterium]
MELLLWRHAEAIDGTPDAERPLSDRGHRQARRMAAWLERNQPDALQVIASPALRTRMTADALTRDYRVDERLGTAASAADLMAAAGWPHGTGAVLIVGHQPTLGELAALLLTGEPSGWSVKKGALWWFRSRIRDHRTEVVLRAVLPAELC